MIGWFDLSPKERADFLRFCAERAEAHAEVKDAEGRPWSAAEAERFRAEAARLRRAAQVFAKSRARRAGDVVLPKECRT